MITSSPISLALGSRLHLALEPRPIPGGLSGARAAVPPPPMASGLAASQHLFLPSAEEFFYHLSPPWAKTGKLRGAEGNGRQRGPRTEDSCDSSSPEEVAQSRTRHSWFPSSLTHHPATCSGVCLHSFLVLSLPPNQGANGPPHLTGL